MTEQTTPTKPMTEPEFADLWQRLLGLRRGEMAVVTHPTTLGREHVRMLEAAQFVLVSARDNQGVGGFYVIGREGDDALVVAKARELVRAIGGTNAVVQHAH